MVSPADVARDADEIETVRDADRAHADAPADHAADTTDATDAIDTPDVPPPGPACTEFASATQLVLPDDLVSASVGGIVPVSGSSCFPYVSADAGTQPDTAPGDVYGLHLAERTGVVLSIAPDRGGAMAVISVRSACDDARTEIRCMTRAFDSMATLQTVLDAGDYFVVATGMPAGSHYRLAAHAFAAPANDACERAMPLSAGATLRDQRLTAAPERNDCADTVASAVYYEITVAPGQVAALSATIRSVPAFVPAFVWTEACDSSCGTFIEASSLELPNTGTEPRTFHVAFGASRRLSRMRFRLSDQAARFDLDLTSRSIPSHREIASALRVTAASHVEDESTATGGEHVLFYRVSVDPDATLIALARTRGPLWTPDVRLLDPATNETISNVAITAPLERTFGKTFTNATTRSRDVVIAVSSSATVTGRFDLSVRVVPPPPNDRCEAPVTVAAPATVDANLAITGRSSVGCRGVTTQQAFFETEIPPGRVLSVIPPYGSCEMFPLDACGSRCTGAALFNDGGAPRRVLLAQSTVPDLTISDTHAQTRLLLGPPPRTVVPSTSCDGIVAFTPGETLVADLSDDLWTTRPALFSTEIPAHTWLRFGVSLEEPSIEVRGACDGGRIWSTNAARFDVLDRPTWVEYGNESDAPMPVVLAVRRYYRHGSEATRVTSALVGRAGMGREVPTECDEMSMAVPLAASTRAGSESFPMPFPFVYRGVDVAAIEFGAFLRLIGEGGRAAGIVAPLTHGAGATAQIFGEAPSRHLTVQWYDTYPPQSHSDSAYSPPSTTIRLQAKLFESSDAIEFHYCSFVSYEARGGDPYRIVHSDAAPSRGFATASYLSDGDGSHVTRRWSGVTNLGVRFGAIRFLPEDE
jgi:hypothetical protein